MSLGDAAFLRLQARKGGSVARKSLISDGKKAGTAGTRETIAAPPKDSSGLESDLKDQLMSLAAVLGGEDAKQAAPVPARPARVEMKPAARENPGRQITGKESSAATKRSEFAPDPIRQRTHIDLRTPAKQVRAAPDGAPDTAKRVAKQGARPKQGSRRWLPASSKFYDDVPKRAAPISRPKQPLADQPDAAGAQGRGLDARTLSIAALVGIGLGFVGLTAVTQFGSSDTPTEVAALTPVQKSASASGDQPAGAGVFAEDNGGLVKEQDRLLPQSPSLRGGIAAEGKTEAKTIAPTDAAPAAPVEKTVAATKPAEPRRQQPGWEVASPQFESPDPPQVLSYAPVERQAAPARQPAGNSSETLPAANKGAGTAKVNTAVNMRSGPDNGASVVAVLGVGTTVQIARCDFWCEVVADGKRGYVFRKFVGR